MSSSLGPVALVHDYLNQLGGAERVFAHIAGAYSQAPIYTSLLDHEVAKSLFDVHRVRVSPLQSLPLSKKYFRLLAPLYPTIFEGFDLSAFDLVISSTTSWAKGVRTRPDAVHVCYINTVSRFAFAYEQYVDGFVGLRSAQFMRRILQMCVRPMVQNLLEWDLRAALRPTAYIANSINVAKRVQRYYGRGAFVLPCPVDIDAFYLRDVHEEYALVVSRLLPYKRIDLAIDGCAQAGIPLVIVGSGPAEVALRLRAEGTATTFYSAVNDVRRAELMASARLVLLPGEEDFGLVPIEAAASGRPTLAFRGGGALETIIEGETGVFFDAQTPASLALSLRNFDESAFHPMRLRRHAEKFAPPQFIERFRHLVAEIQAGRRPDPL